MSTPASPDILPSPPKRGAGVRRINRNPLIVVFTVFVLVMGVVGYTIMEKSEEGAVAARQAQQVAPDPATSEGVLDTAPRAGVIEAAAPVEPVAATELDQEPAAPEQPPYLARPQAPTYGTPADAQPSDVDPYAQEWQAYRQAQAQLRQAQAQQAKAALDASSAVSTFGEKAGSPAASGPAGSPDPLASMLEQQAAQLTNLAQQGLAARGIGGNGGAGAPGFTPASGGFGGEVDPNNAKGKVDWLNTAPNPANYLERGLQLPVSPYEVKTGTVIPGVMISGINSDLPGQIIGQVSENVWDTATGAHLLIPQGARLVGSYDNQVSRGQRRVLVGWNRIIYPDGSSLDLPKMPGADQAGYSGFKDKVNNHTLRVFGDALLLSLFAAGVEASQPDTVVGQPLSNQDLLSSEIGKQMGQAGAALIQRNASIQPTLEIRPGFRFNVMVTRDMVLPPWQPRATSTAASLTTAAR